jgi:hypothetical protein
MGMTAQEAAEALGFKTTSGIYDLLNQGRLTGRKVRHGNTIRHDIDRESVEVEKERRERGEGIRTRPVRPVHYVLPDLGDAIRAGELASFHPEDVRDYVIRKRAEALAQEDG